MKKHIQQFILLDGVFFINLLTEKLWVESQNILSLLDLLDIGVMLTISKVFTILFLLCL